jgi:hypothetical protein
MDMFRNYGYGSQFGPVDPYLMPYLNRNRNTASLRQPREMSQTGTPQQGQTGLYNPDVERARAMRAAQAGAGGAAGAGIAPTGTGSVFMQYSHYYQSQAAARRR